MNKDNYFEDAYLYVDGESIGKVTMNAKCNKEYPNQNYEDVTVSYSSSGTFSIDSDRTKERESKFRNVACVGAGGSTAKLLTDFLIQELVAPSYTKYLEEVKNNLTTLKGEAFEEYYNRLNEILAKITDYAHEHNQISKDEVLVAGLVEGTNTMFFGRMPIGIINGMDLSSSDVQLNFVSRVPSTLGTTEGSINFNDYKPGKLSFSIECKEITKKIEDSIIGTLLDNEIISSFKGNKLDNSEKRGKKGKKIRNWEKKCFWQKGR